MSSNCHHCHHPNDMPDRTRCSRCRENFNIWRAEEQRPRFEENDLCKRCGQRRPAKGKKMCRVCIDYMAKYRESCKERTGMSWTDYCHNRKQGGTDGI